MREKLLWVGSAIQASSLSQGISDTLIEIRKRLGNEYSEVKNYEKALYYFDIAEITIARRLQTRAAAAMQGKVLPAPRAAG